MTGTQLPPTFPQPAPSRGLSVLQIAGIGCVVVLLLFCVLSYVAVRNFKSIAANMANKVIADAVDQSSLPLDQKKRIKTRIDELVQSYKSGKITDEHLGRVMERLAQSPLLPLGAVYAANEKYIVPSDLPQDQKDAAVRTLHRLAFGAHDKRITQAKLDEVLATVQTGPPGDRKLKDRLSPAELQTFLAAAKAAADEAQVPDMVPEVNIADEVDKIIDEALAPAPAPVPGGPTSQPAAAVEGEAVSDEVSPASP